MNSQMCRHLHHTCARNAHNASTNLDARPAPLVSGDIPFSASTPFPYALPPNAPAGASAPGADAKAPFRRYFPLRFGPAACYFSYQQMSSATVMPYSPYEYPPPHTLSSSCGGSCKPEGAAQHSRAPIDVTASAPVQNSATLNQCFFVTLPHDREVGKGRGAHAATVLAPARTSARPETLEYATTSAPVTSTTDGHVEVPALRSSHHIADSFSPVPEHIKAGIREHSSQCPLFRYRVRCRQVAATGSRQHFLVTADPVEANLDYSYPSASSDSSLYATECLAPSTTGREQRTTGYKKTGAEDVHAEKPGSCLLLPGQEGPETLSTTSALNRPASDSIYDDAKVLSEMDEETDIRRVLQKYVQLPKEQRNLQDRSSVQTRVESCIPSADRRGIFNKHDAEYVEGWATRSKARPVPFWLRYAMYEPSLQTPHVATSGASLPAAGSEYPGILLKNLRPFPPQNPFAANQGCPAASTPGAVPIHRAAAGVASSSHALLDGRATQEGVHTGVLTWDGATNSVIERSACLPGNAGTYPPDMLDATVTTCKGLRARRPPPLDPKSLDQSLEITPKVSTSSPSTSSSSCSFFPCYGGVLSSPVTGARRCQSINQFDVSLNLSGGENATIHQQQGLDRCSQILAAPHPTSQHPDLAFSGKSMEMSEAPSACSANMKPRGGALNHSKNPIRMTSSLASFTGVVDRHSEVSGCNASCCSRKGLDESCWSGDEQQQKKRQAQAGRSCLQYPSDTIYMRATAADIIHKWSISLNSASSTAHDAKRPASKYSTECPEVSGVVTSNPAMERTDKHIQKCTLTLFPRKGPHELEKVHLDAHQEMRALEHNWISERFPSWVAREINASPATACVKKSFVAVCSCQADCWMDGRANIHDHNITEDFQLHNNLLVATSPRKTNNVYSWTAGNTSPSQDTCCKNVGFLQHKKEYKRSEQTQNRCHAQLHLSAAEQCEAVFTPPSSTNYNEFLPACCARTQAEASESGYSETVLETTQEHRSCKSGYDDTLQDIWERTPAARDFVDVDRQGKGNPSHCCAAGHATRDTDERMEGQAKEEHCFLSELRSSVSTPDNNTVSAVVPKTYVVAPAEGRTEARIEEASPDASGQPITVDNLLRHYMKKVCSLRNPRQDNKMPLVALRLPETQNTVFDENMQERCRLQDDNSRSLTPPAAASFPAAAPGTATCVTFAAVPLGCCINTTSKGGVPDASKRPLEVTTLLRHSFENLKSTSNLKKGIPALLLEQCYSGTQSTIQKKEAQKQNETWVQDVSGPVPSVVTSLPRVSVATSATWHNILAPVECLHGSELGKTADGAQGARRAAVALPENYKTGRSAFHNCSEPKESGECVEVNLSQPAGGGRSTSSRDWAIYALAQRHVVPAREHAGAACSKVRTEELFPVYQSPVPVAAEVTPRAAVALPYTSAMAPPESLKCYQPGESGGSIQLLLPEKKADTPSLSGAPVGSVLSQHLIVEHMEHSRNTQPTGTQRLPGVLSSQETQPVEGAPRAALALPDSFRGAPPACRRLSQPEDGRIELHMSSKRADGPSLCQVSSTCILPQQHVAPPRGRSRTARPIRLEKFFQLHRSQEREVVVGESQTAAPLPHLLAVAPPGCPVKRRRGVLEGAVQLTALQRRNDKDRASFQGLQRRHSMVNQSILLSNIFAVAPPGCPVKSRKVVPEDAVQLTEE